MNEDAKSKAIQTGKIKGVKAGNTDTFTDSSQNVARFIVGADASLWETNWPQRFERINPAKKR
jgi:hypothetical protein